MYNHAQVIPPYQLITNSQTFLLLNMMWWSFSRMLWIFLLFFWNLDFMMMMFWLKSCLALGSNVENSFLKNKPVCCILYFVCCIFWNLKKKHFFCSILPQFSCFFFFFSFFSFSAWKAFKKYISNNIWSVQHPNAGWDIQHLFQ